MGLSIIVLIAPMEEMAINSYTSLKQVSEKKINIQEKVRRLPVYGSYGCQSWKTESSILPLSVSPFIEVKLSGF